MNMYKFTGKERDTESNLDYFGARYYDSEIGRWLSVDPLADKYPGWSPYNYCLNSPLNLIDPDGMDVVFAKGTSDSFKDSFNKVVEYLKSNNALGPLKDIMESKNYTIIIASPNSDEENSYNPGENKIIWNPNLAMSTTNGNDLSPATMLVHEADHAMKRNTDPTTYFKGRKKNDKYYDNLEEKRVIKGSERRTAKKLGEIENNEETRTDHDGIYYNVDDPTSTY